MSAQSFLILMFSSSIVSARIPDFPVCEFCEEVAALPSDPQDCLPDDAKEWIESGLEKTRLGQFDQGLEYFNDALKTIPARDCDTIAGQPDDRCKCLIKARCLLLARMAVSRVREGMNANFYPAIQLIDRAIDDGYRLVELPLENRIRLYDIENLLNSTPIGRYERGPSVTTPGHLISGPATNLRPSQFVRQVFVDWKGKVNSLDATHPDDFQRSMSKWIEWHREIAIEMQRKLRNVEKKDLRRWKDDLQEVKRHAKDIQDELTRWNKAHP